MLGKISILLRDNDSLTCTFSLFKLKGARLLAMQLKKMKCSTQRAENGKIATDILRDAMPGTFDLVLMDLRMPVMDGLVRMDSIISCLPSFLIIQTLFSQLKLL